MFKSGSIRKIVVENFVTYSYAEICPGPNLNMLIGPNGTGKSTIVAAIILGLGGSPKTVGRGTKVTDYIKHGCTAAKISVYLQGNSNSDIIKVSREFHVDDKNYWKLNNNSSTGKEIAKFVSKYNIQVDNLCQFLPQDRVQDFAKMNKQELLKQTQVAICRNDLMEMQENLINYHSKQKDLKDLLDKYNEQLKEAIDTNNRLEAKVKNFRKLKQFLSEVENIKRKIAWINWEGFMAKVEEVAGEKRNVEKEYEKCRKDMRPIENAVNNAQKVVDESEIRVSNHSRRIREMFNKISGNLENQRNIDQQIEKIIREKDEALKDMEKSEEDIQNLKTRIDSFKLEKETIMREQEFNNNEIEQQVAVHNEEKRRLMQKKRQYEDQIDSLNDRKGNTSAEVRALFNELERIQNVKEQRLQLLQRIDRDAYKAVLWLRENKHLFKQQVYEPMMLEINVLDPNHAIFLENIIAMRDRVAFTCVNKDDMNLLLQCLRQQQHLSVNALHVDERSKPSQSYKANVPIENLMKHGFFAYANSLFSAPEPIMRYLCKFYSIHAIPVGNEKVNTSFDEIPKEIQLFLSNNVRYAVKISRYTGARSVQQGEIHSDNTLAISLDALRVESITGRLEQLKLESQRLDVQIENMRQMMTEIDENMRRISDTIQEKQKAKNKLQEIDMRLRMLLNNLKEIEKNQTNKEAIETRAKRKTQEVILSVINLQKDTQKLYKKYTVHTIDYEKERLHLTTSQKELQILIENYEKISNRKTLLQQRLQELTRMHNIAEAEAEIHHQKAKELSKGFSPTDAGFEQFRADYDRLVDDVEELENEADQITAQMDCLHTANQSELEEYEQKTALIDQLKVSLERGNRELERVIDSRDDLKQQWLNSLGEVIGEINRRFGEAFQKLGCVGDISVDTGENENDFAQYGLSIKVSYRDGEPLQELNTTVQSGGERAVATAAFMLALQELTPVPFRCVDEINQGMDANNERRIFEILVDLTAQPDTAQYFLITPKLVPKLKFVKNMRIHIVHNGPFLGCADHWRNSSLCNPEKLEIY